MYWAAAGVAVKSNNKKKKPFPRFIESLLYETNEERPC
jgi:hypothetical protein